MHVIFVFVIAILLINFLIALLSASVTEVRPKVAFTLLLMLDVFFATKKAVKLKVQGLKLDIPNAKKVIV